MKGLTDNIFRGYDIRGKVPDELNEEGAYKIGRAYGTFLANRRISEAVVVGDNRNHTEKMKASIVEGLLDSGISVTDYGLGMVYFMYFGQYHALSKGGVSVSASHNPKEYNGFKLAVGFSDTLITEEIEEIKEIAKSNKFVEPEVRGELKKEEILEDYKKDLKKRVKDTFNFKLVFDGGNCTPGKFLPDVFREFGCEVIEQNTKLDGDFPLGTPDPTEADYLNRLAEGVKENKADMGVCYDPDGDRMGIVDEDGTKIWNDVLVALFAKDILHLIPKAPIIFNTLPKSGSVYIISLLQQGLNRPFLAVSNGFFPNDPIKPNLLSKLFEVNGITQEHLDASEWNISQLQKHSPIKLVIHVRDPRQAMISWTHHLNHEHKRDPGMIKNWNSVSIPSDYFQWPLCKQFDFQIEHFLPDCIEWIQGWINASKEGKLNILFTTYEDFRSSEDLSFIEQILDFYEIPSDSFIETHLPKTLDGQHFRKGLTDEWREILTLEQQQKMTNMMPDEFFSFFSWSL